MSETALKVACIVICFAVSFLCSGMEAGLFSLSRFRIKSLATRGHARAKILADYLEAPERFLMSVMIGNTIAGFTAFGIVAATLYKRFSHSGIVAVALFFGFVFLFYTVSDLLPKMMYRAQPERFCLVSARAFRILQVFLRPFEWIVERVVTILSAILHIPPKRIFLGRNEIRFMMEEWLKNMSTDEQTMVRRVLDLQVLRVKHLTKPFSEVVTVDASTLVEDVLTVAQTFNFTRLPVWGMKDGRKHIIGIIDVDEVVFSGVQFTGTVAGELAKPVTSVDEDLPVGVALSRMRRVGDRIAIVTQKDGRPMGIVTLTDIVQTIFGRVEFV